jgi:hypothetical protein
MSAVGRTADLAPPLTAAASLTKRLVAALGERLLAGKHSVWVGASRPDDAAEIKEGVANYSGHQAATPAPKLAGDYA